MPPTATRIRGSVQLIDGARRGDTRKTASIGATKHMPLRPGVDRSASAQEHAVMESPNDRREVPRGTDFEERLQAWLELKREMELLHAHAQYLSLILRLGVRLQ